MAHGLAVMGAPLWGGGSYSEKVLATQRGSIIAYWPLWEASGTVANDVSGNGRNGATSGATLGVAGIGDGRTAYSFDGINDFVRLDNADFLTLTSYRDEGSFMMWWTVVDIAATRYPFWICDHLSSYTYRLLFEVTLTGILNAYRTDGAGVTKKADYTFTPVANTWYNTILTWSVSGNYFRQYLNGALVGTPATAVAAASANTLVANRSQFGAHTNSTPAGVHKGKIAHGALWSAPLTVGEIAALAKVAS